MLHNRRMEEMVCLPYTKLHKILLPWKFRVPLRKTSSTNSLAVGHISLLVHGEKINSSFTLVLLHCHHLWPFDDYYQSLYIHFYLCTTFWLVACVDNFDLGCWNIISSTAGLAALLMLIRSEPSIHRMHDLEDLACKCGGQISSLTTGDIYSHSQNAYQMKHLPLLYPTAQMKL